MEISKLKKCMDKACIDILKRYMGRASATNKEIEWLEKEYNFKQKEIDSVSLGNSEIRGNKIVSKVECKALELIQLKQRIDAKYIQLDECKKDLEDLIDMLEDEIHRKILKLKYLEFKKWDTIADILGYSYKHTFKLHNYTLKKVIEIIKLDTP